MTEKQMAVATKSDLKKYIRKLKKYARHSTHCLTLCNLVFNIKKECTCGFDKAMKTKKKVFK